ncbi:MAG TPA: hypothetical protein DCY94_01060 [Firmicutes bacterium]|nr:hypothetical protein [Bacillota bacterium]
MKIILINGLAQSGKTTTSHFIRDYYKSKDEVAISTSLAKYIKMYARELTDWDGKEETKPRAILQGLGSVIRDTLGKDDFLCRRLEEDIELYALFSNITIIDDARLHKEIEYFKKRYSQKVIVFHITRPNYESNLSAEEKGHITEQGLDNYDNCDYTIVNDGTLCDLKHKVYELCERIDEK